MRFLNVSFIILFMAMMILPLVFVDLSPNRVSEKENRMLAERPKFADMKSHPGTFIRDFDAWFKDSTGFREKFITLYKIINDKWLNTVSQYTDGQYVYIIGEAGHHYFAGETGRLIPKFQGKQFLSDDLLKYTTEKLEETKMYLDSKGIPFIVMFCADKESVYPEFYPKSIKRGPEPNQLDVITNYLQKHTNVDIFNTRQALLAEKKDYQLYNVSSGDLSHHNQIGAFFAYRELMKHINIYLPEIVSFKLNDIDISYDTQGIPSVSLKEKKTYKKLKSSFFDDKEAWVLPWEKEAFENTKTDLPSILFIRGSFGLEYFIEKYLAEHFRKTICIHYRHLPLIEELINQYKPDIVVFSAGERELIAFASYASQIYFSELPYYNSDFSSDEDSFEEKSYNIIISKKIDNYWKNDASIGKYENGNIYVQCGNIDPQINNILCESGSIFLSKDNKYTLSIKAKNSVAGMLEVFYGFDNAEMQAGINSVLHIGNDNKMQYYNLPLPKRNKDVLLTNIRIDPPNDTLFEIESISLIGKGNNVNFEYKNKK